MLRQCYGEGFDRTSCNSLSLVSFDSKLQFMFDERFDIFQTASHWRVKNVNLNYWATVSKVMEDCQNQHCRRIFLIYEDKLLRDTLVHI